ncbi:MAG: HaeIII family restriction endonuclease [Candidatus Saccharibacteria bacterium]|nr:HaeIII family restriction endonuclease [Candidatus Saccharibacteria bacterium]
MSDKSNNQGRAFEYIFIHTLKFEVEKRRLVEIEGNSSLIAAERAWNSLDEKTQSNLKEGATAVCSTLFDVEPLLIEPNDEPLTLKIQPDDAGVAGDVRDVLASYKDRKWEIGFSLKHNHFAVKHSRLSKNLDFGKSWYGIECSDEYWKNIKPIFSSLEQFKNEQKEWKDIPDKAKKIYIPLLDEFAAELKRADENNDVDVPAKLVEYLLGKFDFYKIVSQDTDRNTKIQAYNLHGELNKKSSISSPALIVPVTELPTRIIHIGRIPDSDNTVELALDKGWHFTFRIHSASTKVETSLKFDIRIIGIPTAIVTIDCPWQCDAY